MNSRRKTGVEGVRLYELSRRTFLAAPSALGPSDKALVSAASNEGTIRCRRWLAIDAKMERLQTRWATLENWLVEERAWFHLTPAQQQASSWAQELHDIDACLSLLSKQSGVLLRSLPGYGSAHLDDVIARLAVVKRVICPEDHPEAHALIRRSCDDLMVMAQAERAPA